VLASLVQLRTAAGQPRLVLVYQDGEQWDSGFAHARKLHAECLFRGRTAERNRRGPAHR
jgi:hypothetical protein